MKLLVLGNPENRRVRGFVDAWTRGSGFRPDILSWERYLIDPESCESALGAADLVRIESPGENWRVEKLLLERGAVPAEVEGLPGFLAAGEVGRLIEEPGRILPMRQWFLGWASALETLDGKLRAHGVQPLTSPETVKRLFDKKACHHHCGDHGIAVPSLVACRPSGFDEVWNAMDEAGCDRVFIKPRHGSSASGVIALRRRAGEILATTSITREGPRFMNSLRVRRYQSIAEIRSLVDFVCRQSAIVERWLPKCGFAGRTVDLRVVTTRGRAGHFVLRGSRGPLTNLHLGNERGDVAAFQAAMEGNWSIIPVLAEQVAASLPDALHLGIDLLVAPSRRRVAVAEINAFGDLLPRIRDPQGRSTWEAQVDAIVNQVSTTGR